MSLPSSMMNTDLDQRLWWVIRSRPRCEKKIAHALTLEGMEAYLPCRNSRREYKSKTVTFQVPLFPGYVFGSFSLRQKQTALTIPHLAGLLAVEDQATFTAQLTELKNLLERSADISPCPFIEVGRRVRITTGRFKGIEGRVTRISGKERLVLNIDFLRQSVEVELPADAVALAA